MPWQQPYRVAIELPSEETGTSPEEPDLVIANQLFSRLHQNSQDRSFAIGLPDMRMRGDDPDNQPPSLGRTLEVFAPEEATLDALLGAKPIHRLLRDHCLPSRIRQVPEQRIAQWVRYRRDRSTDQRSPARIRREQRLYEAGQLRYPPPENSSVSRATPYFHHASRNQTRNGHPADMYVFVQYEPADGPGSGAFNSFGLARRSGRDGDPGGAVPLIRGAA